MPTIGKPKANPYIETQAKALRMSRYYFHLDDHRPLFIDDIDGVELPNDAAACAEVEEVARELAKNVDNADLTIVVTNERGMRVYEVRVHGTDARTHARGALPGSQNEPRCTNSFDAGLSPSPTDRMLRRAASGEGDFAMTLTKEQCLASARESDEEAEMTSDPEVKELLHALAEQWFDLAFAIERRRTLH